MTKVAEKRDTIPVSRPTSASKRTKRAATSEKPSGTYPIAIAKVSEKEWRQAILIDIATALDTALEAVNAAMLEGQDLETMLDDGSVIESQHLVPLFGELRQARSHLRYVTESDLPELGSNLGVRLETYDEKCDRERDEREEEEHDQHKAAGS